MAKKGCCSSCFSFLIVLGLTSFVLWLTIHTAEPKCSIQEFYVPALNKTANSTTNHTIYFDLKLDNDNIRKGIYYDAVNLTFYYGPDRSLPIGNYTVPGFYQGYNKNTRRRDLVETQGVPWEADLNGSLAIFRVDLATAVRFKFVPFKTKRRRLVVGATVQVNEAGVKVSNKKGIRLHSSALQLRSSVVLVFCVWLFVLFN